MPSIDKNIMKMGIALMLVGILLWVIKDHNIVAGDWDLISNSYIALFPYLLFTGVAIIYIFRGNELSIVNNVLIGAMIGVGFSLLIQYYYDNNIWFDSVVTGSNYLWELQLLIVTIWVIIGIIKGSVSSNA